MRSDALDYRASFPMLWRDFLHSQFDCAESAAAYFAVDGTTAKKWWAGLHAPVGSVVGYAFDTMPDAAKEYLVGRVGLVRTSEPTAHQRDTEAQIKQLSADEPDADAWFRQLVIHGAK